MISSHTSKREDEPDDTASFCLQKHGIVEDNTYDLHRGRGES